MRGANTNINQLTKHLVKGDEEAYEKLINILCRELIIYAKSLTNDTFVAEDLVQNAFVKLWENRSRFNEKTSIKSYLYKTVYNEFIDQYRKSQRVFYLEKEYIESLKEITRESNDDELQRAICVVKKEIKNLPVKSQEVFVLSKQEGLTNIEIADYLSISIKTVEAHITKSFAILRKKLFTQKSKG